MIALLGSLWPFIVAGLGIAYGVFKHLTTAHQTAKAVDQAKVDTTVKVQQDIANQTAVAATNAQAEAIQARTDASEQAAETAKQGRAALDAALTSKGALRD